MPGFLPHGASIFFENTDDKYIVINCVKCYKEEKKKPAYWNKELGDGVAGLRFRW